LACLRNFVIELALRAIYKPFAKKNKKNERTSEYLQEKLEKDVLKNRFISNYFKLVTFRSLVPSVFSDVSRKFEIFCKVRR